MDKHSLQFSLDVVPEHECEENFLVKSQRLLCLVNLLAEGNKDAANKEGSRILKHENCLPRDLRT